MNGEKTILISCENVFNLNCDGITKQLNIISFFSVFFYYKITNIITYKASAKNKKKINIYLIISF